MPTNYVLFCCIQIILFFLLNFLESNKISILQKSFKTIVGFPYMSELCAARYCRIRKSLEENIKFWYLVLKFENVSCKAQTNTFLLPTYQNYTINILRLVVNQQWFLNSKNIVVGKKRTFRTMKPKKPGRSLFAPLILF